MTLHTIRTTAGNGFRAKRKGKEGAVAIMARLTETDFNNLRRIAVKQGIPMAAVIRDAITRYLRRRGHE